MNNLAIDTGSESIITSTAAGARYVGVAKSTFLRYIRDGYVKPRVTRGQKIFIKSELEPIKKYRGMVTSKSRTLPKLMEFHQQAEPVSEMEMLYKRLRAALPTGFESDDFNRFVMKSAVGCAYADMRPRNECSGPLVLDHVLGGYHKTKACGLLKVPSCQFHNQLAEQEPKMHKQILPEAILLMARYLVHLRGLKIPAHPTI